MNLCPMGVSWLISVSLAVCSYGSFGMLSWKSLLTRLKVCVVMIVLFRC